ncbi:MAG: polyprenyl synthetase family protein [candidate division Zixibacteria bacterium]|nr:polyprenyl synthetase family protein [candidate division Zixibacteria bacterium]
MELNSILGPVQEELNQFEKRFDQVLSSDSEIIYEISQHLLKTRGKRLRPASVLLCARACGLNSEVSLEPALAIELIHTATLLHDDVIDESAVRRGQHSVNRKWNNTVSILMGDYLFAKAFKELVGMESSLLYSAISKSTEMVSIGQLDEIRETRNFNLGEEAYLRIITNKTASLFAAACQAGSLLADAKYQPCMYEFGKTLGIAFQITDDLLDYVGSEKNTGKEVGKDLLDGKVTLPLIFALQKAPDKEKTETLEFLQNGYDTAGFPRVSQFVEKWGGLEYSSRQAQSKARQAAGCISALPESRYKDSLHALVKFAASRSQ